MKDPFANLWIAKISRHLMDLATTSKETESQQARDYAKWFIFESRELYDVCDSAGYHPDYVRKAARNVMKNGITWVTLDYRGKNYGKRKYYPGSGVANRALQPHCAGGR